MKKEKNIFRAARGREVMIFPGSGLFNKARTWLVAAEMVETTRLFIRTVANIDSSWLELLGKELCKYTYLHPRWERNREEVVATEQVSLFGLIIVPERKVAYGKINAEDAFDIFIRDALIGQDVKKPLPFMVHNLKLINQVKNIEDQIRRRDLLVSEEKLVAFYKKKLPVITNLRTLSAVIKEKSSDAFLRMDEKHLYRYFPDNGELSLYPDELTIDNRKFFYSYKYEPGAHDDGITVKISSDLAAEVPSEAMDWMVPGLLKEKISALIKGLPKKYRTRLVPTNKVVDIVISEMPQGEEHLATALSKFIARRFGFSIPAAAWPLDKLADHLKMRIAITDQTGKVLSASRDKTVLQQNIHEDARHPVLEQVKQKWEKNGITRWNFGDLPETISHNKGKGEKRVFYLGLEKGAPGSKSVNLRVFHRKKNADTSHLKGVTALFSIYLAKELTFLKKKLRLPEKQKKLGDYFGGAERIEKKINARLIKDLFTKNIRSKKAFEDYGKSVLPRLYENGQKKLNAVLTVLETYHEARSTLFNLEKTSLKDTKAVAFLRSLQNELVRLVPATFIDLYGDNRLILMGRYIKAISIRAQRGLINLEKDLLKTEKLSVYTNRLEELLKELTPLTSDEKRKSIEEFFWLLEEYKISLFAQELKTALPVSQKRLDRKLVEIEALV
jgi:ATP-dependent helicase HrpA